MGVGFHFEETAVPAVLGLSVLHECLELWGRVVWVFSLGERSNGHLFCNQVGGLEKCFVAELRQVKEPKGW